VLRGTLTTRGALGRIMLRMAHPVRIHKNKTPRRNHYIAEWAERRAKKQADIVRALGADKGTVSRWFDGVIPTPDYLDQLAGFLQVDEITALFRHPDDDWLARLLRERPEERDRIRAIVEAAVGPVRTGTGG
jgi:transcriptional regulator with XRE-family HTH domain